MQDARVKKNNSKSHLDFGGAWFGPRLLWRSHFNSPKSKKKLRQRPPSPQQHPDEDVSYGVVNDGAKQRIPIVFYPSGERKGNPL